ncbi:MAG: hypothetical protein ACKO5Q_10175, partial [Microcystaceae cyanobacterium]
MKRQKRTLQRSRAGQLSPWSLGLGLGLLGILVGTQTSLAQSLSSFNVVQVQQTLQVTLNTAWVVIAGCLIFLIITGLSLLAAGFCRQKNAVNLLTQNLLGLALAVVVFWGVGFALMFGDGNSLVGFQGFFLLGGDNSPNAGADYTGVFRSLSWAAIPLQAKFFFQVLLAAIPGAIVAGAVAERIQFFAFLLFNLVLVGIIYPIAG